MEVNIKIAESFEEIQKAFAVRHIVFCEGQQVPYSIEHDNYEFSSFHILGEIKGEPIAAGRIRIKDNIIKLERIAVRHKYRGEGIGHKMTIYMLEKSKKLSADTCFLHAQSHLIDFYKGLGFKICGELFYEANIAHFPMKKEL